MYVFQLKILLLQYGGLTLLLAMVFYHLLSKDSSLGIWLEPVAWLMVLFLFWQIWKSHDSIAPLISWRDSSRVFWLPIIALSVATFFKNERQLYRLLDAIIVGAVIANILAWLMYVPALKNVVFGDSAKNCAPFIDAYDLPVVGDLLKNLCYPAEFKDVLERKLVLKGRSGEGIFPISSYSFFAGKEEAGTFGNKNFLAGYINLTTPLMLFRVFTLSLMLLREKLRPLKFGLTVLCIVALTSLSLASLWHLVELQNRGSWIGFAAALVATGLFGLRFLVPARYKVKLFLSLTLMLGLSVGVLYQYNSKRFTSIFSMSHGSNELRRLIWTNYTKAWWSDRDWEGFENDSYRRLTGFGFYTFRTVYPKVRPPRIFNIEYNQHNTETSHPHNEYLGYLGELGLVGLGLYLSLMFYVLRSFLQASHRLRPRERLLCAALLFALVSQWGQQTVSVGVRYTGVAFQLWLTMGFILAVIHFSKANFSSKSSENASLKNVKYNRYRLPQLVSLLLLGASFLVFPHWDWPYQWFRSQHYFEMGQIYFGSVREAQQQASNQLQQKNKLQNFVAQYQQKKLDLPQELQKELMASRAKEERIQRMLDFYGPLAEKYFKASFRLDPANFESLYIMAIMKVQLANTALGENNKSEAEKLFSGALSNYETIEDVMPYFVQIHYWKGVCYKGLGVVSSAEASAQKYSLALESFNRYEQQDPYFKELFLDRYFCYARLQQPALATQQLVQFLLSLEKSGEPLFDEQRRYDARAITDAALKGLDSKSSELALAIMAQLMDHRASSCLLPFMPKTDRHVKNGFRLLRERINESTGL
jgi:O-antigen ligase